MFYISTWISSKQKFSFKKEAKQVLTEHKVYVRWKSTETKNMIEL